LRTWIVLAAGLAIGIMLRTEAASGQGQASKCPRTPEKLEGQVVSINLEQGKITVKGTDGMDHEFQASKETIQEYQVGDRIQAKLRSAPECK
jgi:hypothetical protein